MHFFILLIAMNFQAMANSPTCDGSLLTIEQALDALVQSHAITGQESDDLLRSHYAISSGGLCGITCLGIFESGLELIAGLNRSRVSEGSIIRLTDQATISFGMDARLGLEGWQVMQLLSQIAAQKSQQFKARTFEFDNPGSPLKPIPFQSNANILYLFATEVYSGLSIIPEYVHVSIGYGFNKKTNSLKIIDPLDPKPNVTAQWRPARTYQGGLRDVWLIEYNQPLSNYPDEPFSYLSEVIELKLYPK